jgi:hypothetical protein
MSIRVSESGRDESGTDRVLLLVVDEKMYFGVCVYFSTNGFVYFQIVQALR